MEILSLIRQDHVNMAELFRRLFETSRKQPELREALIRQLRRTLLAQLRAEDTVFYFRMEEEPGARDLVHEARLTLVGIQEALDHLEVMNTVTPMWEQQLKELQNLIRRFMLEKESRLLGLAQHLIPGEQLESLGDQMAREQKEWARHYAAVD